MELVWTHSQNGRATTGPPSVAQYVKTTPESISGDLIEDTQLAINLARDWI